jgi:DNA repair photolyase
MEKRSQLRTGLRGQAIRGRGSAENPTGRFERLQYADDPAAEPILEGCEDEEPRPSTLYLRDPSRRALTYNESPDIPFEASLNPYRGCEHGCVYCYARPTHEYLGMSAGLDFESRILVKEDAPRLLRRELSARAWRPRVIAMSGVTDPYQPIERKLEITRRCLEVLVEFRNPVAIITKNALVARDADLLACLSEHRAAAASLSITTLDPKLQRILEPRASPPRKRLEAIEKLSARGIPVGVMVAPIIPGLTDHEVPEIVAAAARAGASYAGQVMLRLPHGVGDLFAAWLERHFPDRKSKVLGRVRAMRGGRLNDSRFGSRMRGEGIYADQTRALFDLACRKAGFEEQRAALDTSSFKKPGGSQLGLFEASALAS